jgi:predicted GNAT family acetyltransferase
VEAIDAHKIPAGIELITESYQKVLRSTQVLVEFMSDLRWCNDRTSGGTRCIRHNPSISRFEMPLGDGALAVAYYKVEDGRVVVLHTEVPQALSGLGYGSRLAHGDFEALRRDGNRE